MKKNIVVTGGAGFIGSNLVESLLQHPMVNKVHVIDNLSNGSVKNIDEFFNNSNFEFTRADIRDYDKLLDLTKGYDLISHQAALGSVPRSIKDPLISNEVNISGTLNILQAAVQNKIKRVVLACSSSTYGDSKDLPKKEDNIGNPLSPYAVTKYVNELYADVFNKIYKLEFIGLRYFNVFGPKQSPDNPYAAVIPLFCKAILKDQLPQINGDGLTSRDFTYVENAVQANVRALFSDDPKAINQIYNVACGQRTTLNELIQIINEILGKGVKAQYKDERPGDVKHSLADITKISRFLGYQPNVNVKEGLEKSIQWYIENN